MSRLPSVASRESYSQNRRVLYPAVLWLLYGHGPIGRREIFLTSSLLVEIEGYFSLEFVNYVCETEDRSWAGFSAYWSQISRYLANSHRYITFLKKSAILSAISELFYTLTINTKTEFFSNYNRVNMFSCLNIFKMKFRYFPATLAKLYSATAIEMSPLFGFIFC
jgi:hypothetical protein